ncbi:MAG: hypothetical protein ABI302_02635 [Lacisediminihabitans sp.]
MSDGIELAPKLFELDPLLPQMLVNSIRLGPLRASVNRSSTQEEAPHGLVVHGPHSHGATSPAA